MELIKRPAFGCITACLIKYGPKLTRLIYSLSWERRCIHRSTLIHVYKVDTKSYFLLCLLLSHCHAAVKIEPIDRSWPCWSYFLSLHNASKTAGDHFRNHPMHIIQSINSPLLQSRSISWRFSCISSLRRGRGRFILADIVVHTQNHYSTPILQSHHNKQCYKTANCTIRSADVHCVTNAVVINRYNLPTDSR